VPSSDATLWEIDIHPAPGQPNRRAQQVAADAIAMGLAPSLELAAAHGYLVQGRLTEDDVHRLAAQLLADQIVERAEIAPLGDRRWTDAVDGLPRLVHVLPKPGVMDPVALSATEAAADAGFDVEAIRTFTKYWLPDISEQSLETLCRRVLANDAIEQIVFGPLALEQLELGGTYRFEKIQVPLASLDDAALMELSRTGQLYLSIDEMRTIQQHFRDLEREPTDVELETIAQTWSEHCSHKTLKGRVRYRGPSGTTEFSNLLKETVFAATQTIRERLGGDDWCVSVFEDNAGVVRFAEGYHAVFKAETHNHPSAIEPYGGANTGLGGVIRDPLGTGLGAKPVCNTDVFCFAPPDTPLEDLPPGVLHPRSVIHGVVAGVRDYGNRMGIPTVNGAIYFDPRYLGNPLVFCGNVALLPVDRTEKAPRPGDHIVAVGGRTGRDGIHGATFSSAELHSSSDELSGGAVQIGNAIAEKKMLDVILAARDAGLYSAITDCGAGGFSSAVGEMGAEIGAEVWLDRAPLKYSGLSYTEIWISEAQERMVLAVPPEHWQAFEALCRAEDVEATVIGKFEPTGRLRLRYDDHCVADLDMEFLHDGRPPVVREAAYEPPPQRPLATDGIPASPQEFEATLKNILGALNVASKEWVIRQYDHEVQAGSVVKPLVGRDNDGPSDAAVVRPLLDARRGLVIACGMNPRYGDLDTYHMAASAIDEAVRNCVAVGADPKRIAILDNFCWGNTDRPETLGSLVRAALACRDVAIELGTPFISGKDSLNNEFRYTDDRGQTHSIAIPPTLLISALGQMDDVERAVTMDFKEAGNAIYLVGRTHEELGGSHFALTQFRPGGRVPQVDAKLARATFAAVYHAIHQGSVRACHDLSEGGLAVALAEMAFAGGLGAKVYLENVPHTLDAPSLNWLAAALLFSESNTRFLCEVSGDRKADFEAALGDVPHAVIGVVDMEPRLQVFEVPPPQPSGEAGASADHRPELLINADIESLKQAWQAPLRW